MALALGDLPLGNSRTCALRMRSHQMAELLLRCADRTVPEPAFLVLAVRFRERPGRGRNLFLGPGDQRLRHGGQPYDAAE